GRRAGFRYQFPRGSGSSSLLLGTNIRSGMPGTRASRPASSRVVSGIPCAARPRKQGSPCEDRPSTSGRIVPISGSGFHGKQRRRKMAKPVVGIIGNAHVVEDSYPVQAVGISNIEAVAELTGAIPLLVPALPKVGAVAELVEACDGFVFTGGRPNIHPSHYGQEPTEKHGAFDPDRDALALPLIHECVARGVPIFGICRGFQEFNVAFGGTLHPEIREIPGRMNHRMPPDGTLEEKFAI